MMSESKTRIFSLGDSALTVEFGSSISTGLNKRAIALSDFFRQNPFPGFVESVPAYASTTIFFDIWTVRKSFPEFSSAFDAVKHLADQAIDSKSRPKAESNPSIEIPFHFDAKSALDLDFVAKHAGISTRDVIEIFTNVTYRVFMLGFLPGFSYMGEVDERIATPRKDSPRLCVPKGSIAIAGKQAGIYSLESPGGWQILGRTDVEMFKPDQASPSLLKPGDKIRFVTKLSD